MSLNSSRFSSPAVLAILLAAPVLSSAQEAGCRTIDNDTERLACYDRAALRSMPEPLKVAGAVEPDTNEVKDKRANSTADGNGGSGRQHSAGSTLNERWELDPASKRGIFVLRPYQPMFILPISYTNRINQAPSSSAPGHTLSAPVNLTANEAKFQISVKTKAAENLFGDNGDLWLGYTQSSHWQVYNGEISRPFRETNYEPEAMLVFRTNYELLGFKGTMAGIGFNHQSNGRALPLSRSWNRIIAQAGFERGDWMVMLRPWVRLPESSDTDDNPGIENYIGRGDVTVVRKWQGHVFSAQARHSLRAGENSRGSAQLTWSFPIAGDLKGYVQLFSGYGESMIDFNHRQTVLGLGLSVVDWF